MSRSLFGHCAALRRTANATLCAICALFTVDVHAELFAAVLPSSRSVPVGEYATFFATVINAGSEDLENCGASVRNNVGGTFWYRPAQPGNNFPIGERSTAADIAAGQAQAFYLEYRSNSLLAPVEMEFDFTCDGTVAAPVAPGVNTLLFSANANRTPDVIALTATTSGDGIVNLPTDGSRGFFTAATSNVGAGGLVTVSVIGRGSPSTSEALVCQSERFTGACLADPAPAVTLQMNSRSVHTFSVFLRAESAINFDPANNRVVLQFADSDGAIRGATSVAVRSADLTIGGLPAPRVVATESYEFIPTIGRRFDRAVEFSISNKPSWLTVAAAGRLIGQPSNADVGVYPNIQLSLDDGVNQAFLPPFSIEVLASPWRFAAALPYDTAQHSMASLGSRLFYVGGSGQSNAGTRVREYDQVRTTWASRTGMPATVRLGNAHGVADKLYVFGGNGVGDNNADHSLQIYDPALERWTQQPMPFNRYGVASAEVDGFIYFFGGYRHQSFSRSNQSHVFSTTTQEWVEGPLVPVRCDGSAAAAIGRLIYLTGGCNTTNNTQVHVFDTDTGSWSETTSMPVSLAYHSSVAVDGLLYVLGGYEMQDATSGERKQEVYVFDPATAQWSEAQPMRTPRSAFGAAVVDGEIWVSGGYRTASGFRTDLVEVYSPNLEGDSEGAPL